MEIFGISREILTRLYALFSLSHIYTVGETSCQPPASLL